MHSNKSLLKYGLISICIFFAASTVYYMSFSLKEPVFLKHYYERAIYGESQIFIHYIKNSDDDRKIIKIFFPQLEGNNIYVDDVYFGIGEYRNEQFAHYTYKAYALKFNFYDDDSTEPETFILDKAVVLYDNGDKQDIDIGKIVIHKNMKKDRFFEMAYSSSNSNFSSSLVTSAIKDVTVEKIESMLNEDTKDFLVMKINNEHADKLNFPFSLASGEKLSVESSFIIDEGDVRKYNVYDMQSIIYSEDEEGNKGYDFIYNMNYEPYDLVQNEKEISKYLKIMGVK